MSNSHVRSAKAIAGAVAYFRWVLVIGDGGLLLEWIGCPAATAGANFQWRTASLAKSVVGGRSRTTLTCRIKPSSAISNSNTTTPSFRLREIGQPGSNTESGSTGWSPSGIAGAVNPKVGPPTAKLPKACGRNMTSTLTSAFARLSTGRAGVNAHFDTARTVSSTKGVTPFNTRTSETLPSPWTVATARTVLPMTAFQGDEGTTTLLTRGHSSTGWMRL